MTELREDKMELRALVSAADSGKAWDLRCYLREELVNYLTDRHAGALPRPRMEPSALGQGAQASSAVSPPIARAG